MRSSAERPRCGRTSPARRGSRRASRSQALGIDARNDSRSPLLDVTSALNETQFSAGSDDDSTDPLRRHAKSPHRRRRRLRHVPSRSVDELHLSSIHSSRYQCSHLDLRLAIPTTPLPLETRSISCRHRRRRRRNARRASKLGGNGVGIVLLRREESAGRRGIPQSYDGVGGRCRGDWVDQ